MRQAFSSQLITVRRIDPQHRDRNVTTYALALLHPIGISRVWAVAQYAVLEANGKGNVIGEKVAPPTLPNPWTDLDAAWNI